MPIARSRPQTNLDYAMLFVGVVLVVFTVGYRLAGWGVTSTWPGKMRLGSRIWAEFAS